MAKRLVVLMAMAAAMLVAAVPAMAQEAQYATENMGEAQYASEEVSGEVVGEEWAGFGSIESVGERSNGTMGYGLAVSEEEGYYLEGDFDFAAFEGRNAYVAGRIVSYPQGGTVLRVERIEPAEGEYATEERTVHFELTVEGEPPDGAAFFGLAGCCGTGPVGDTPRLTDSDGDGVYTGTGTYQVTVDTDGAVQPMPVDIWGGIGPDAVAATQLDPFAGEDGLDIVPLGDVAIEDGQTFSASYTFGTGEANVTEAGTPGAEVAVVEEAAVEGTVAEETIGDEASVPEETIAVETRGATGDAGETGVFEDGGALGFLPDSGGGAVLVLGIGALLAAGGFAVFRALR